MAEKICEVCDEKKEVISCGIYDLCDDCLEQNYNDFEATLRNEAIKNSFGG